MQIQKNPTKHLHKAIDESFMQQHSQKQMVSNGTLYISRAHNLKTVLSLTGFSLYTNHMHSTSAKSDDNVNIETDMQN